MTWRLAPDPSGCRVIDHDGRERGRQRNANLQRILRSPSASLDALRGQIASAQFFDHLGKECYR
jgi:hypothetical protein